jgi:predicted phosphodiesterase
LVASPERFEQVDDFTIIGLISDTHGLLRPEALAALKGSDLIIHAGDVGKQEIIEQLRAVAPVVAVKGNIDKGAWASPLPMELDLDPAAAEFNVVVSGHSHKPGRTEHAGVLYVNPGSAGPRRFQLPITVARLDLGKSPWSVEFIELAEGQS